MNQNKLSFKSENLVVDYLSFNMNGLKDLNAISKLRDYLYQLGFKSRILSNQEQTNTDQLVDKEKLYEVKFSRNSKNYKYWTGYILQFSGIHAARFYQLLKANKIDWKKFTTDSTKINFGRIDLYYLYQSKHLNSEESLQSFMEGCCQKIKTISRKKNARWEINSRGFILTIGSRKSANYLRVYTKLGTKGLKFELEMKKEFTKSVQNIFFSNQFEEFESKLSEHFYQQFKGSLILDTHYTDWLLVVLRKTEKPTNSLVSHYLRSNYSNSQNNKNNRDDFYKILKFLSFIRRFNGSRHFIGNQIYYLINFSLIEFLEFTKVKNKNQYQRQKALKFLASLEDIPPLVQKFSDKKFRKSIMIPYLEIEKKNNQWIISIAIGQELYVNSYPFWFPNSFLFDINRNQQRVNIAIIESYCQTEIVKEFPIQSFLDSVNASYQTQTNLKKLVIKSFSEMENIGLILKKYKLVYKKGEDEVVHKLQIKLITKIKYIYFYENINYGTLTKR